MNGKVRKNNQATLSREATETNLIYRFEFVRTSVLCDKNRVLAGVINPLLVRTKATSPDNDSRGRRFQSEIPMKRQGEEEGGGEKRRIGEGK